MKSARLEWCLGNLAGSLQTIKYGLEKFPEFPKFYLMKGQIEIQMGHKDLARNTYDLGIKRSPNSIPLWTSLATLETNDENITKARSILEKARVRNPVNDELWVHAIRLEVKAGNDNVAQALLARALQTCPKSGRLWSECIFMAPRPARKTKSVDGLKNCDNDANVSCAAAIVWYFYHCRRRTLLFYSFVYLLLKRFLYSIAFVFFAENSSSKLNLIFCPDCASSSTFILVGT